MTTRSNLLRRLADGDWHAGPDLATALGVSRAAVSKAMAGLREQGLTIQSGRAGYRIAPAALPVSASEVVRELAPAARDHLASLQTLYRVDSTNSWLLRRSRADEGTASRVCIAARQTAGRGRLGRGWDSPPGAGLYLSMDLDCVGPPASALPLAVAVMVAEAIESAIPGSTIRVKWPNDLLLHGRKVGGILMESRGEYGGRWRIVIGLGLNLTRARAGDRTSLAAEGFESPSTATVAGAILNELLPGAPQAGIDPRPWLAAWRARDHYQGAEVWVTGPLEQCAGRAAGVDDHGALLLRTGTGERRFIGGDVSLRGA